MAYNDKKMIEDINGDLPPQYFNNTQNRYEDLRGADGVNFVGNHVLTESGIWVPQKGSDDGAAHMQVTGSKVEEKLVVDAHTLKAGESLPSAVIGPITIRDEFIIMLRIRFDRSGFTVRINGDSGDYSKAYTTDNVYPLTEKQSLATSTNPYLCFPVAHYKNLTESVEFNMKTLSVLQKSTGRYRVVIDNESKSDATLSVEVVRIWGAI